MLANIFLLRIQQVDVSASGNQLVLPFNFLFYFSNFLSIIMASYDTLQCELYVCKYQSNWTIELLY